MPEPPKITTSLADRIARLNATQKSSDRNHSSEKKEIGEIKSKISKYEASGQFEGPLIPKGSFGLGAPLTKPDRGLDRIRIASCGVSGGVTVTNPVIPSSANLTHRSVSLGRPKQTNRLSSASAQSTPPRPLSSSSAHSLKSPTQLPTNLPDSPPSSRPETPQDDDHPSNPVQNHSAESTQVYDGILEAYPTTPAEEESPPMVTCSNCTKSIELELLADHVCDLSLSRSASNGADYDPSMDATKEEFPVDVPASPTQEPSPPSRKPTVELSPPPAPAPQLESTPPKLVIKECSDPEESVGAAEKVDLDDSRTANRSSHSSNSTNTNRMSSSTRREFSGYDSYRSWHDDDDDDEYANSAGPTGFVTIVRSSSRI